MKPSANASPSEMQQLARRVPVFSINARSLGLFRFLFRALAKAPRPGSGFLTRLALKSSPVPSGIRIEDTFIVSQDQARIRLRIYQPRSVTPPAPALLWMHGGGYVIGAPEQDDAYLIPLIQEIGLVAVSVDYRLAPEHPFPAPLEDCYAALHWLADQANPLGIDPQRVAVGGSSAGAGLAAALAQLAHVRRGHRPAFQFLVYPMLDDRTAAHPEIDPHAHPVWNNTSNRFGWESYLQQPCAAETAPQAAVPARQADLSGLPPAWIGVGSADLFFEESADYARRLNAAGTPCELVVVPGAFHGFDLFAPRLQAVKDFRRAQVQALKNALLG